jgi:hypothetical protein
MGFFSDLIDAFGQFGQANAMHKQQLAYAEYLKWRAQMFENGWGSYEHTPPDFGIEIMLMRDDWHEPIFRKREDLRPEMNVNGLMWKAWTGKTIEADATKMIPG